MGTNRLCVVSCWPRVARAPRRKVNPTWIQVGYNLTDRHNLSMSKSSGLVNRSILPATPSLGGNWPTISTCEGALLTRAVLIADRRERSRSQRTTPSKRSRRNRSIVGRRKPDYRAQPSPGVNCHLLSVVLVRIWASKSLPFVPRGTLEDCEIGPRRIH